MTQFERDLGALEARMETVEQELHAIRQDVRDIRDALVKARGGWLAMTMLLGLAASVGAVLGKWVPLVGTR